MIDYTPFGSSFRDPTSDGSYGAQWVTIETFMCDGIAAQFGDEERMFRILISGREAPQQVLRAPQRRPLGKGLR